MEVYLVSYDIQDIISHMKKLGYYEDTTHL